MISVQARESVVKVHTALRNAIYTGGAAAPATTTDDAVRRGWPPVLPLGKCPRCMDQFAADQDLEVAGCSCLYHKSCVGLKREIGFTTCTACGKNVRQFTVCAMFMQPPGVERKKTPVVKKAKLKPKPKPKSKPAAADKKKPKFVKRF